MGAVSSSVPPLLPTGTGQGALAAGSGGRVRGGPEAASSKRPWDQASGQRAAPGGSEEAWAVSRLPTCSDVRPEPVWWEGRM